MSAKARFKTTIRFGAAHNEVLSVSDEGERVSVPLDKATHADRHALAGTLCQLHGVTGKPRKAASHRKAPRIDIAEALDRAVASAFSTPDTTVRLIVKETPVAQAQ